MSVLSRGSLARYRPYKNNLLKIALKSFLLGALFTLNLLFLLLGSSYTSHPKIHIYLLFLVWFYSMEFTSTVVFNNPEVDDDSFILEDKEMHFFTVLTLLEHYVVHWTYGTPRVSYAATWLGLSLAVGGQAVRTLSMYTAAESFNHYIQRSAREKHRLVTHGVYGVFRHPSYFGFFVWFVGLQVFLNNVGCLIVGGVVIWRFFRDRIGFEEKFLVEFFGEDYVEYRRRTRTWMMI